MVLLPDAFDLNILNNNLFINEIIKNEINIYYYNEYIKNEKQISLNSKIKNSSFVYLLYLFY